MEEYKLTQEDEKMIEHANEVIKKSFEPSKHRVAAVLSDENGALYEGINLKGDARHINVCAEEISLGNALMAGAGKLKTIVAVRHPMPEEANQESVIISPCGSCRDLLDDYGVEYAIILDEGKVKKIKFKDLIPFKYEK